MSEAIHEIIGQIERLTAEDRMLLDEYLAQQAELEWRSEAEDARRLARLKGIDQTAIDRAIEKVRYGP